MNKNKKIAWIIHPRNMQDIKKSNKIFSILPNFIINIIIKLIPPYIISSIDTNIKTTGVVIVVPMLSRDFKKNKKLAEKKIIKAIKIAQNKNINHISTGGFISSMIDKITDNNKFNNIKFYDGSELLSIIASKQIENLIEKKQLKKIGILGATTNIGKKLSKNISEIYKGDIILFGTNKERLNNLSKNISVNNISHIETSTDLNLLKTCDLVALTTYINDDSIASKIKPKSIFFSIIEPISPFVEKIEQQNEGVFIIRGVSIHTPGVFYKGLNSGLEKGYSYACITEAYIMMNTENSKFYDSKDKINKTFNVLKKFNFKPKNIKNE